MANSCFTVGFSMTSIGRHEAMTSPTFGTTDTALGTLPLTNWHVYMYSLNHWLFIGHPYPISEHNQQTTLERKGRKLTSSYITLAECKIRGTFTTRVFAIGVFTTSGFTISEVSSLEVSSSVVPPRQTFQNCKGCPPPPPPPPSQRIHQLCVHHEKFWEF